MTKKEIKVPSPGESVFEVTVGSIKHGQVNKGESIVVFETDKAALELTAEESGEVSWRVQAGDIIKVGDVIGHIKVGAEAAPAEKPAEKAVEKPVEKKVEVVSQPAAPAMPSGGGMRKTADDFVADLHEKPETPKEVVVSREATEKRERMPKIRKVIAERLVQVKNETAMLSTFNEVDLSAVMAIRNREKDAFEKKHGVKLGFMSFFVKACVAALKEFPHVHARIEGDEIVTPLHYNIAVAVGTDKGLFVPVLKNCEELSFAAIEKEIKHFGTKAKEGKILPDDMRGGSFTITNGGVYGSLLSTPIINPPQSAILGMHAIKNRPIDVEGVVALRPMMYLALSYDHRIIDGKAAVGFLVHIKETLEHPDHFFLDL